MGSSSLPGEKIIVPTSYTLLGRLAALFLLLLGGATLFPSPLPAQGVDDSSPLGEKTIFPRFGVEGGFDLTEQDGAYSVGCGTFEEGSATNVTVGGTFDVPITVQLRIEGILGLRTRGVNHSYRTDELSVIQTADGFVETTISYNNVGSIANFSLFAQPSIRYAPKQFFYVGAGVNAGVTLASTTRYRKDIITRVVELADGSTIEAFFPATDSDDPYSRSFTPEKPESAGIILDPIVYAGLELRFDRVFLGPRLTYAFPLMPILTNPELTLSSMQLTLGARYNLE